MSLFLAYIIIVPHFNHKIGFSYVYLLRIKDVNLYFKQLLDVLAIICTKQDDD
jgi:hypothetical protein